MTARETPSGGDGDRRVSASRRTFLLLAGSSAGVGLSATPAGGTRAGDSGEAVTIVASPSHRDGARATVERLREKRSTDAFSVHAAETTAGLRRFAAGDADVLVGSRPPLPAERSRAAANDVAYARRELPTARAALRHPESSWVDCLPPADLAETWAGDGTDETWAEVAPRAATGADVRQPTAEASTDGAVTSERRDGWTRPTRGGTVLVRGVRAYQYASGFGGVGYYEPDRDWFGRSPGATGDGVESHTTLVRLAFLYANRDSLRRRPVDAFVRAYARRSTEGVGAVPFFEDPFGGG